jgi:hypothetical protein
MKGWTRFETTAVALAYLGTLGLAAWLGYVVAIVAVAS